MLLDGEEQRLPGIYLLLFAIEKEANLPVGRLGVSSFAPGWYAYVGSAMAGVGRRVRHHLRPPRHPHWHIDYLLQHGELAAVIWSPTSEALECALAASLGRRFQVFRRFGSSDCRCPGHLFYHLQLYAIATAAIDALRSLGCGPRVTLLEGKANDALASYQMMNMLLSPPKKPTYSESIHLVEEAQP